MIKSRNLSSDLLENLQVLRVTNTQEQIEILEKLHNEDFSEEKNKQVFGKCNNPMGHGHDYYLELTVKGDIEEETGMILNIEVLDEVVLSIIDELDHKRLDIEIDYFTKERASGENIAKYLWKNLADKIPSLNFILTLFSVSFFS